MSKHNTHTELTNHFLHALAASIKDGDATPIFESVTLEAVAKEVKKARVLRGVVRALLTITEQCNPQDPTLQHLTRCPVNHPNCCGRCAIVHRARRVLKGEGRAL